MVSVTKAGTWGALALDLVGFIFLLSGVASMQEACGGAQPNVSLLGGRAGYNTPAGCDNAFGYTWWFTFYNLAFWIAAVVIIKKDAIKAFRPGLIGLASITIMQSTVAANTYLIFNTFDTTSTFKSRARVTVAGAIFKAIGTMILVACLGFRDENSTWIEEKPSKQPAQEVIESQGEKSSS